MPAPHPAEFRQRAVALARTGATPVGQLAKELQISESCLRNWLAQADADEGGRPDRLARHNPPEADRPAHHAPSQTQATTSRNLPTRRTSASGTVLLPRPTTQARPPDKHSLAGPQRGSQTTHPPGDRPARPCTQRRGTHPWPKRVPTRGWGPGVPKIVFKPDARSWAPPAPNRPSAREPNPPTRS
jgi:transposase-like protein